MLTPPTRRFQLKLGELWSYRELLYFFTWRDIKIRYKQTLFGVAWAVIQPTMMMVVFTVVLGRMAKVDSGDLPYPVFVYAGLLPWTFFANAITNAGNSIVGSQQIITKIYFPRLAIPFAAVGACVVDFAVAFGMLLLLMFWYGVPIGWGILLTPVLLSVVTIAALGVGCLLSALNVAFRDFKYTIPFLVQIWLFATPSVYMRMGDGADENKAAQQNVVAHNTAIERADKTPSGTSSHRFGARELLRLNPMTGLIEFFRSSLLGGELAWSRVLTSTSMVLIVFFVGLLYFRRVESSFADII